MQHRLFKLGRDNRRRQTSTIEIVCDKNGKPVLEKQQRLGRATECFKEQLS